MSLEEKRVTRSCKTKLNEGLSPIKRQRSEDLILPGNNV